MTSTTPHTHSSFPRGTACGFAIRNHTQSQKHQPPQIASTPPLLRGSGFTLIELLLVITLLGSFSLIAAKLFNTAFSTIAQTKRQAENIRTYDQAIDQLQTDIWNADDFSVPNPNTLLIDLPENQSALWLINDTTLERAHSRAKTVLGSTTFQLQQIKLNFELQQGQLAIHQPLINNQPKRTTWLTNQKRILWSLQQ